MRRLHVATALAGGLVCLLLARTAWAAAWVDCFSPNRDRGTLTNGQCARWTETGTSNSGLLELKVPATCVNTGTTNWAAWSASCTTGTAANEYWTTRAGATCGPTATTDDCGTTELPAGCWVFVPAATGASAECKTQQVSP